MIWSRCSVVIALFGLGACANSTATAAGVPPSTAIVVDPAEFLGRVPCSEAAGGMRLYVATLKDLSPLGTLGLVLPSSLPASCHVPVLFENIVDGRQYSASVDGYDRTDIDPLAPGSSVMIDRSTRAYVAPRWTTKCADHRYPPSLRDAGAEAGTVHFADSGLSRDGGYRQCAPVPLYGPSRTPWLDGPVCAVNLQTITARGCDPLHD